MNGINKDAVAHAADLISQADALVIAAGAGMGVDSGLPDFRGNAGFWKAYPALAKAGLEFTRIASPLTFDRDPELAWGFYGHRLRLYRETVPHAGFAILRSWSEKMLFGAAVFTSNVDGQFQKSGFAESQMFECHGSIHWLQCTRPCGYDIWPADALMPVVEDGACRMLSELPRCPHCGAIARPNILMFSDSAWHDRRAAAQEARLEQWLSRVNRPVVVELGAGSYIASVRHFSGQVIYSHGGRLIRINPRESQVPTSLDVGLGDGALASLEAIDAELR